MLLKFTDFYSFLLCSLVNLGLDKARHPTTCQYPFNLGIHSMYIDIPFILQQKFFSTVGMDRNESNTLIFIIKEGEEPGSFTSNFPKWSDDREK